MVERSNDGEGLALFTVNDYQLCQLAKLIMRRVATVNKIGGWSEGFEVGIWQSHIMRAAGEYRLHVSKLVYFSDVAMRYAAVYCANHYRDELRDCYGCKLPEMPMPELPAMVTA